MSRGAPPSDIFAVAMCPVCATELSLHSHSRPSRVSLLLLLMGDEKRNASRQTRKKKKRLLLDLPCAQQAKMRERDAFSFSRIWRVSPLPMRVSAHVCAGEDVEGSHNVT